MSSLKVRLGEPTTDDALGLIKMSGYSVVPSG